MQDLKRRLGAVLRGKRSGKNWSQKKMAEEAGLSRTSVVYIEKGAQDCSMETFVRLSSALGVEAHALLEEILKLHPPARAKRSDPWVASVLSK